MSYHIGIDRSLFYGASQRLRHLCKPELELRPLPWCELPALVGIACDPWPCSFASASQAWGERQKQVAEVGVLWRLGLNHLKPHKVLDGLCTYAHCLCIPQLHFVQAVPVVLLGKAHVPQELGDGPLKKFIFLWLGFSMPFSELLIFLFFSFSLFFKPGVWTQDLGQARQVLYHWAMSVPAWYL